MDFSACKKELAAKEAQAIIRPSLRTNQILMTVLGALLALCGALGATIAYFAAGDSERWILLAVFAVVALLPGLLLLRSGLKPMAKHELLRQLGSVPDPVRSVGLAYMAGLFGYRAGVSIKLTSGRSYHLNLPVDPAKRLVELLGELSGRR
jgi:hypothetical protein